MEIIFLVFEQVVLLPSKRTGRKATLGDENRKPQGNGIFVANYDGRDAEFSQGVSWDGNYLILIRCGDLWECPVSDNFTSLKQRRVWLAPCVVPKLV